MTLSMTMTLALQGAVRKGSGWLGDARARVAAEPAAVRSLLPAVGRHCGRDAPLTANGWRSDDAARVLLLASLPMRGPALVAEVSELYRYGDADEKRAVLRALPWLEVGDGCVDLLRDALRTNDTRLVGAALGPYAENLDDAGWRQGVLKCVFMQVPLSVVDDLHRRADKELAVMLTALLQERLAAGRTIPDDAMALLHSLTPEKVV